jgi:hypothetical protein
MLPANDLLSRPFEERENTISLGTLPERTMDYTTSKQITGY